MDNIFVLWKVYRCTLCNYRTRFFCKLQNHLEEHVQRPRTHRFICQLPLPEKHQCEECFTTNHKTKAVQDYLNPVLKTCENCDFETYSLLVLLSHQNRCHRTVNHVFQTSQTKKSCQLGKNKERKVKLKIGRFQCDQCSYETARNTDLNRHILCKHTPSEQINWFKCEHCTYKAKEKSNLRLHFRRHHAKASEVGTLKRFECQHCSYEAATITLLNVHVLRKHTPEEEINWLFCEHCSYKAKENQALRYHFLTQHSKPSELEKLKRFKCDQCSYETKRKRDLNRHILGKHTSSEEITWFKCDLCSFKAKEKYYLCRHICMKHANASEVEKLERFESNQHLSIISHSKPAELEQLKSFEISKNDRFVCQLSNPEKYACNECQFQSDLKILQTEHFNTIHKRAETQVYLNHFLRNCENCDFQTYSSLVLLTHQNRCNRTENHNFQIPQTDYSKTEKKKKDPKKNIKFHNLKQHHCNHCSYKSIRISSVKTHILCKHTPLEQINWLQCKQCSFKTKTKALLDRHFRAKHSQPAELEKLKRFRCDQCSYKTLVKSSLKSHMLSKHTPLEQINWFKCGLCFYRAKKRYLLRRHVLVTHRQHWKV